MRMKTVIFSAILATFAVGSTDVEQYIDYENCVDVVWDGQGQGDIICPLFYVGVASCHDLQSTCSSGSYASMRCCKLRNGGKIMLILHSLISFRISKYTVKYSFPV